MMSMMKVVMLGLVLTGSAVAQTAAPAADQWQRSDKSDAFSGTSYTEFVLTGAFLAPPQNSKPAPPKIILHCKEGERKYGKGMLGGKLLSAYVAVGTVVSPNVMFRLDDGKPQKDSWSSGTAGTAVFFDDTVLDTLLYSHFMPHRPGTNPPVKKLVIAADEAFAAQVVMEFDLPDVSVVERVCGVTYLKP